MPKRPRSSPAPGETISLNVLDETAVGMRIHADPQGSLMDNWTMCYNASERSKPDDQHVGRFCMIRTEDGRNLSMRLYRTHGSDNWTLVSAGGAIEEGVAIDWVAPVKLMVPR